MKLNPPETPDFPEILKLWRVHKGLKLEEVAEKIGCSTMTVSMWERDKREPSIRNFEKWCQALGLKIKIEIDEETV